MIVVDFSELLADDDSLATSPEMKKYHHTLKLQVKEALVIASDAKSKGFDPKKEVEIYIAQDVASRTEGLVGPPGIAKRLKELEDDYNKDQIVVKIAQEIARGEFSNGDMQTVEELADQALRTALSYQTEGITAAPIEGISKVRLKPNQDGNEYLAVYYAGPIRSAGGTAQGVSVIIADIIRETLELARYEATPNEVERMLEEVRLYNKIMHLQLPTSDDEIRHAWKNIPVMITGDPTEKEEVGGYRDIESMDSNRVRGGACLVLNDGLVGRAKKITKRIKKLNLDGWGWLDEIAAGKFTDDRETDSKEGGKPTKVTPDYSFASDALMGRPTFSDATEKGGFRLRYGHARNTGIAGIGIHPGTMAAVKEFLAPGTHIRTERPGKGSIVAPIDSIKPPVILLKNGDVVEFDNYDENVKIIDEIEEVLFIGDQLIGVGEFFQNNYRLVPPGWNEEWWALEMIRAGWQGKNKDENDFQFFARMYYKPPGIDEVIKLASEYDVALHPKYTPAWIYITPHEVEELRLKLWEAKGTSVSTDVKKILEKSFILHKVVDEGLDLGSFIKVLQLQLPEKINVDNLDEFESGLTLVQQIAPVKIRDIMGTTIGSRMGRPEKAKARLMKPQLNGLFPVGTDKKIKRLLSNAIEKGEIDVFLSNRYCTSCNKGTYKINCDCGRETILRGKCKNPRCRADMDEGPCDICGSNISFTRPYTIDMNEYMKEIYSKIDRMPAVVRLKDQIKNPQGIPEILEKGILRARYNLNVFRDGTIRYDATDAPLTHFYAKEAKVSVDKLKELGYTVDIFGDDLNSEDQLLEIKPQDIILHTSSYKHLRDVANFVDDELTSIYKMPKYYNIESPQDLVGHLVIGLAPHTSAGVIGRIIGYTDSSVCWAHPFWHSSKRRNCVDYNEELIVYNEQTEQIQKIVIGKFIENLVGKGYPFEIVDDYNTKAITNPYNHLKSLSISEDGLKPVLTPIKNWILGSSDEWITITTKSGSRLRMTGNHQQIVWDAQRELLYRKNAIELKETDILISRDELPDFNKCKSMGKNLIQEQSEKRKLNSLGRNYLNSNLFVDKIKSIEFENKTEKAYCVEIGDDTSKSYDHNITLLNAPVTGQCDGDEDGVILLLDGFINFSKVYLPTTRGSKMDTPLVLVATLNPNEVDDEAFNLDSMISYPLEFYKAASEFELPSTLGAVIHRAEQRLGKPEQYEGYTYSHPTSNISEGPKTSKYKDQELDIRAKLDLQLDLAKIIRAVESKSTALRILEKHVLPDLMGNLRAFASQQVRCVTCNTKYRRVPLAGKCKNKDCPKSNIILTVPPKGVSKYYDICKRLVEDYDLGVYHENRLERIKIALDSHFPEKKRVTFDLADWLS